jgi:hypothetical protein
MTLASVPTARDWQKGHVSGLTTGSVASEGRRAE